MGDAIFHSELVTWRPVRYLGVATSLTAFTISLASICSKHWLSTDDWQNAVIGLLIFSVGFGFLAMILSICGVCTLTLPKKIYYYHSAGEIYFICALSSMAALIVYPTAMKADRQVLQYQFGVGYGLGWGAAVLYFTSAMCMCLDDLIRTLAKGLCRCCTERDSNSRV